MGNMTCSIFALVMDSKLKGEFQASNMSADLFNSDSQGWMEYWGANIMLILTYIQYRKVFRDTFLTSTFANLPKAFPEGAYERCPVMGCGVDELVFPVEGVVTLP